MAAKAWNIRKGKGLKIKITQTHNSICSNLLDMVNHENANNVYYICSYNKNGYLFSIWPETKFTNVKKINEILQLCSFNASIYIY